MTNTAWQQSSPLRRYLANGTDEDSVYTQQPEDDEDPFAQQLRNANEAGTPPNGIQPQSGPVNDLPGPPPVQYIPPQDRSWPQGLSDSGVAERPAPPEDRYSAAIRRLETEIGNQPKMNKPNWLERVAAGAMGAAAGWTNAAGRIKNPIDIQKATEGILHPGYQQEVEAWKSRVAPLQAQAEIEGQRQAAGYKGQQIQDEMQRVQNETQLKAAQAQAAREHGQYWLHRAQTESARYKVNNKGEVIDQWTGETKNGPPTKKELYEEAMAITNGDKGMANYYALNNGSMSGYGSTLATAPTKSLPTATEETALRAAGIDPAHPELASPEQHQKAMEYLKPRREVDPEVAAERRQRAALAQEHDDDGVNGKKISEERILQSARTNEVNAILQRYQKASEQDLWDDMKGGGRQAIIAVNRKYAPQLQGIEDSYADALTRRGKSVTPLDVNPNTLQYTARHQAATAPGPGTGPAPVFRVQMQGDDGKPVIVNFKTPIQRDAFKALHPGSVALP